MKKILIQVLILCLTSFYSCVDEIVVDPVEPNGKIILNSEPQEAQIFLLGTNTGKVTPDSISNLEEGNYQIALRKTGFLDTAFTASVYEGLPTSLNIILKPVTNEGEVFFESEPPGAEIFLSNLSTGKITPDTIKSLPAGIHEVTLKLNGYEDTTINITIIKDQLINKFVVLTKIIDRGNLFIESQPSGAQIFLEGNNTGDVTPDTISSLETGNYDLTLKLPGYYDTTFSMTVLKDQVVNKNIELTRIIERGNFFIQSQPPGAEIFLQGINTGKITPDTLNNLEVGDYELTLKLVDFHDTTFSAKIEHNKITFINIILTEELPADLDTLYYNFTIFSQTQFTFSFNQDITLEKVEAVEPDSAGSTTFYFNDEFIQKGSTRTINYSRIKNGEWSLIFYGNKVSGIQSNFVFERKIKIPEN